MGGLRGFRDVALLKSSALGNVRANPGFQAQAAVPEVLGARKRSDHSITRVIQGP